MNDAPREQVDGLREGLREAMRSDTVAQEDVDSMERTLLRERVQELKLLVDDRDKEIARLRHHLGVLTDMIRAVGSKY